MSVRKRTIQSSELRIQRAIFLNSALCILSWAAFAASVQAAATDIYLSQGGTGGGTSCTDAKDNSFFSSASNWGTGSGQIGPGTTVHLCGTITGIAGGNGFIFQGSGTAGNPITLLFEPGANLTAPYWGAAITINSQNWIMVDGGSNGVIQNTQDGTGLAYQVTTHGIQISGASNITVKNLSIINLCQVTSPTDSTGCEPNGVSSGGIAFGNGSTNITITHNLIHDVDIGIFYGAVNGDSGNSISYNTIYRVANSAQLYWGTPSGGTATGLAVVGNDLSCSVGGANCNWADTTCRRHLEAIHVFLGTGVTYDQTVFANNFVHDMGVSCVSGGINLEANGGLITNTLVYNNLFVNLPSYAISGGTSGLRMFNNTLIGDEVSCSSPVCTAENNIVYNSVYTISLPSLTGPDIINYNSYYGWNQYNGFPSVGSCGFSCPTLALWQAGSTSICPPGGCDLNSITANPDLTGPNFVPVSTSPVVGAGTNLASLGIPGLNQSAPQFFGVNYACGNGCVSRPAMGPWDIGAYQYSTSTSQNSPCDLNGDGAANVADVQLEVNMALGVNPCANTSGTCTVVSVQRVVNAALGGTCVSP